jgi:hypothetical protein
VVSFRWLPLYSREKKSEYLLDRRLDGTENRSECVDKERNFDPAWNTCPFHSLAAPGISLY